MIVLRVRNSVVPRDVVLKVRIGFRAFVYHQLVKRKARLVGEPVQPSRITLRRKTEYLDLNSIRLCHVCGMNSMKSRH